jgi:transposase
VMAFFEGLAPCVLGMEACATAHHWARELTRLGHEVRLMPAKDVMAYGRADSGRTSRLRPKTGIDRARERPRVATPPD